MHTFFIHLTQSLMNSKKILEIQIKSKINSVPKNPKTKPLQKIQMYQLNWLNLKCNLESNCNISLDVLAGVIDTPPHVTQTSCAYILHVRIILLLLMELISVRRHVAFGGLSLKNTCNLQVFLFTHNFIKFFSVRSDEYF